MTFSMLSYRSTFALSEALSVGITADSFLSVFYWFLPPSNEVPCCFHSSQQQHAQVLGRIWKMPGDSVAASFPPFLYRKTKENPARRLYAVYVLPIFRRICQAASAKSSVFLLERTKNLVLIYFGISIYFNFGRTVKMLLSRPAAQEFPRSARKKIKTMKKALDFIMIK